MLENVPVHEKGYLTYFYKYFLVCFLFGSVFHFFLEICVFNHMLYNNTSSEYYILLFEMV